MRLLYACAYLPARGISGGSGRMFEIIRRMAHSHEVDVLTFYERDDEAPAIERLRSVCSRVTALKRGQSLADWRQDILHQIPQSISLEFGNPEMRRCLALAMRDRSYDLADVQFLQMSYLLPPTRCIPAILTHFEVQHRVLWQRFQRASWPPAKLALAIQFMRMLTFEIGSCKRYDRVLTMSDVDARSLKHWDRTLTIGYNNLGVDCDEFSPDNQPLEDCLVVFTGYFRHTPNVDAAQYFVRSVLPRVRQTIPHCRLLLVGGEPPPEIQSLARCPGVTVTGWLDDLRPLVQRAAVVVAPIVSGAGQRTKILEAWSLGKAVVSTTLGVEGLNATHDANVWLADTPAAFADFVVRALLRPEDRKRLGVAGRLTATRDYAWPAIVSQLELQYRQTIDDCNKRNYGSSSRNWTTAA